VWCMGGKVKEILGCSKVYSCTRKTCKSTVKKVSNKPINQCFHTSVCVYNCTTVLNGIFNGLFVP
jgi:hypothetical protein